MYEVAGMNLNFFSYVNRGALRIFLPQNNACTKILLALYHSGNKYTGKFKMLEQTQIHLKQTRSYIIAKPTKEPYFRNKPFYAKFSPTLTRTYIAKKNITTVSSSVLFPNSSKRFNTSSFIYALNVLVAGPSAKNSHLREFFLAS